MVFHRALESLDAEENWLQQNREGINERIERGEGLKPEESLARMEAKKHGGPWRTLPFCPPIARFVLT